MTSSLLVVVPTLNSYLLLPRLIDSLHSQTFAKWKLLFIDGGSNPDHCQWLDQLCAADPRCRWLTQDPTQYGIFGAMNQGFVEADPNEWLLFWGSDDWAAASTVFSQLSNFIQCGASQASTPDLLVCRGRYVSAATGRLSRPTCFRPSSSLTSFDYRRSLWFGSTPPHQATVFGPGARRRLAHYSPFFRLSGDLDYFLKLSDFPDLFVQCLDLELVYMADSGLSGQLPLRRLKEVTRAYHHAFGLFWWFPFITRYIRRLASLFRSP